MEQTNRLRPRKSKDGRQTSLSTAVTYNVVVVGDPPFASTCHHPGLLRIDRQNLKNTRQRQKRHHIRPLFSGGKCGDPYRVSCAGRPLPKRFPRARMFALTPLSTEGVTKSGHGKFYEDANQYTLHSWHLPGG